MYQKTRNVTYEHDCPLSVDTDLTGGMIDTNTMSLRHKLFSLLFDL